MKPSATILLVVAVALALGSPVQAANEWNGYAAHYRPGLMERVAKKRKMPKVACMMSSPWHPLGVWLEVSSERSDVVLRCRTTDVSQPRHQAGHRRRGVFEFDWLSYSKLCNVKKPASLRVKDCAITVREVKVVQTQGAETVLIYGPDKDLDAVKQYCKHHGYKILSIMIHPTCTGVHIGKTFTVRAEREVDMRDEGYCD